MFNTRKGTLLLKVNHFKLFNTFFHSERIQSMDHLLRLGDHQVFGGRLIQNSWTHVSHTET